MFGMKQNGQTDSVIVKVYRPFFYVKVDDNWNININRKLWIDTLRDLEIPFGESQGAYYICFDISKYKKSSKEVSQELREKHKLIINSQDEKYLRASFMADKDTLENGLNKLSEYFKKML